MGISGSLGEGGGGIGSLHIGILYSEGFKWNFPLVDIVLLESIVIGGFNLGCSSCRVIFLDCGCDIGCTFGATNFLPNNCSSLSFSR